MDNESYLLTRERFEKRARRVLMTGVHAPDRVTDLDEIGELRTGDSGLKALSETCF